MLASTTRTDRPRRRSVAPLVSLALLHALFTGCAADSNVVEDGDEESTETTDDDSDPRGARDASATPSKDAGRKDAGRHDAGAKDTDAPDDAEDAAGATSPTRDAGAGATRDAGAPRDAGATRDAGAGATRDAGRGDDPSDDGGAPAEPPPTSGDVCTRWKSARRDLSEGTWSGNAASCEAGDMTPAARENALRLVNLYRSLAGLAPVTMTEENNRLAQACALMMRANGTITHTPPTSWKCYTAEGARTAGGSSLSSGPAVSSVDGYMIDPGNPTTIGHRRWILSSWLTEVGFGSADRFSCQYQPAKSTGARSGKAWVAWPPAGAVPIQAFSARFGGTLDQTGWTVQSDGIALRAAQVSVRVDGAERPVAVTQLGANYGSTHALRFTPNGWTTKAGETYHVTLSGVSPAIEYDVQVVDCP